MIRLEELKVYELSMTLADDVWKLIEDWDYFRKDTLGKQLIRAVDSIAANISEGYGRYHYKESKLFGYYARGSLYETKTWLTKAYNRNMISKSDYERLSEDINALAKLLNNYIKSIGTTKNGKK